MAWNSVKEGMPTPGEPVLVLGLMTDVYVYGYDGHNLWRPADKNQLNRLTVTHWMPLPRPPEE